MQTTAQTHKIPYYWLFDKYFRFECEKKNSQRESERGKIDSKPASHAEHNKYMKMSNAHLFIFISVWRLHAHMCVCLPVRCVCV